MNTQNSLIHHPSSLRLVLTRTKVRGEYTHGYLTIDGTRICDTLENAKSCVPAGVYPIRLVKCKQYARKMPVLIPNAPCSMCKKQKFVYNNTTLPCYCPMLKPGNGVHNRLDGSILVGKYNGPNSLIHPREAFDPLFERIRKALSRGNKVTLTIIDG